MDNIKLILNIIWQLPQTLVAILMIPFIGKMKLLHFKDYCWVFECEKMSGGISLGNFIFLSPSSSKKQPAIQHELGHVKQSHMLGWMYLFIIGIPSILNAIFGFTKCYYHFYTESWANKLNNITCKNCKLYL